MTGFKCMAFILAGCIIASSSFADIYEWTDENGVKHYSNYAPPPGSKVLMKTKEEPYDEEADRARMEAERRERLEMARLEIAEREIELELREAEAERRIAEADRLAQEALQEADYYREEARYDSRIIYRGGSFWGGGYWCRDQRWDCRYPVPYRWYERTKYNYGYDKKRHHRTPYQHYLYVKKHYGPQKHHKKDHGYKYRVKDRSRQNRKYAPRNGNTHRITNYRANRMGSGSRFNGGGNFSRGRSGFGMRR